MPPAVIPLECKDAARMLTTDWLFANLSSDQIGQLKSPGTMDLIRNAVDIEALAAVFEGVGIQDLEGVLVRDIIQKDLSCHEERSTEKPPYDVSILFPVVQGAVLEFLQ